LTEYISIRKHLHKVSKESMQIAQTWGMSLGGKLQGYLAEKGM
jgi:hypothetical protein